MTEFRPAFAYGSRGERRPVAGMIASVIPNATTIVESDKVNA
jgi:hypothetical protein